MTIHALTAVYTTDVVCASLKSNHNEYRCSLAFNVPAISLLASFSVLVRECITQPFVAKAHRMQNILAVVTLVTDVLSKAISSPPFF